MVWPQMDNHLFKKLFHLFTTTLLSLLLPLSFLLLSRLLCSHYFQPLFLLPTSFLPSLLSSANSVLLFTLVSLLSIATLLNTLLGKPIARAQPRLTVAWIVLCTLQICVGLGIENGIATTHSVDTSIGVNRSVWCGVLFWVGLHETMLHWVRVVVKPVVDDTIFGVVVKENWIEGVAMAASYGSLWWLRLRDEVDSLVIVMERKMDIGLDDFAAWGLYYVIVLIGFVKIIESVGWFGKVLICRRGRKSSQFCESEGVDEV